MAKGGQNRGVNPNLPDFAQEERDRQKAMESLAEFSQQVADLGDNTENAGRYANALNTAMYGLHTSMQGLSTITGIANLALNGFSNTVQAIAGHIGGLVRLVNPGVLDQFQRAFAAFQAQLGTVFLPVLVGLTGVVRAVADAIAGLSPRGKTFLVFLAGAAAGLTAAVTIGGAFVAVVGSVAGALSAGAIAAEAFGIGLDAATAGLAAVGAVIGAALTGITSITAAGAGGLGALSLTGGSMQSLLQGLTPFLQTLIGAIESAGAAVIPQATAALQKVIPPLMELFSALVQYLPLVAEVVATVAVESLPAMIQAIADIAVAMLPLAVAAAKASVEVVKLTAAITSMGFGLISFLVRAHPLFQLAQLLGSGRGQTGNAPQPVTSASYTGIEDLYKRSQEQAILGTQGRQETFGSVMNNQSVINRWATAIAVAIASSWLSGGQSPGAGGAAMEAAMRAAAARS